MDTASYVAGTLFLILATIARVMVHKNAKLGKNLIVGLFGMPSKNYPEDVFASIGQFMGVSWILVGIFLTITKDWFSSSLAGVILEPLIVFIPFMLSGIILKILTAGRRKQQ